MKTAQLSKNENPMAQILPTESAEWFARLGYRYWLEDNAKPGDDWPTFEQYLQYYRITIL